MYHYVGYKAYIMVYIAVSLYSVITLNKEIITILLVVAYRCYSVITLQGCLVGLGSLYSLYTHYKYIIAYFLANVKPFLHLIYYTHYTHYNYTVLCRKLYIAQLELCSGSHRGNIVSAAADLVLNNN